MARYTINLSEVCEELTGVKFNDLTGNAFDRIDTIANAAAIDQPATGFNSHLSGACTQQ